MEGWGKALILAALLAGVGAVAVLITTPAEAASINGKLVVTVYELKEDGSRELLPGARVGLSQADGQFPPMGLNTNAQGQATFGVVPVGGNYVVTVQFPGFGTVRRDEVRVIGEQTTNVVVALSPERTEVMEVVGREQVIELEKGGQTETEISGEFFQDLPVQGREYQNILELAAGVQDLDDDGNPNVHGARATEFQMNVDGVSNVDPLTGEFQSRINADSIEEMRIVDSGADASYGGAAGGYGEIITKSGGNEFEGTFNFFFQDSAFDNDQAGGRDPLDFGIVRPSLYVSGPIIKDHLWYMASHELYDAEIPFDLIGGADFVQDQTQWINRDKLTWQVTPKNKLQFQFSSDPLDVEPLGVSAVRPPETGVSYSRSGPSFTLTWTSPFSPTFFWEATVGYSDIEIEYEPFLRGNRNTCVNPDQPDAVFTYGDYDKETWLTTMCDNTELGNLRSGTFNQDYYDNRKRWTYGIDAEQYISDWLGGQHRVKFGVKIERAQYYRLLDQRDYLQRSAIPGANSIIPDISGGVEQISQNTLTHFRFYPEKTDNESRGDIYAFYITDSYEPLPNLSINVGLRVSREELRSDGFVPFDPRAERQNWIDFFLGGAIPDDIYYQIRNQNEGGFPAKLAILQDYLNTNAPDSCAAQFINLGFGPQAGLCWSLFLFENDIQIPDGQGGTLDFVDNGGFTFEQSDLPSGYPGNVTDPLPTGEAFNWLQSIWATQAVGLYYGSGLQTINGPGQLSFRQRETFDIINNNIEPRVSVAWDPWDDGKSKVSMNWGRYYQNTFLAPLVDELGPYTSAILYEQNNDDELVSGEYGLNINKESAFQVTTVSRDLQRQYTDEFAIGFEREIAPETSISFRYLNRKYEDKLQDIDTNHVPVLWEDARRELGEIPFSQCEKIVGADGTEYADCTGDFRLVPRGGNLPPDRVSEPDGRPDLEVASPFYQSVYEIGNYNDATYEAYIVELERRYYRNWELRASYTWSEALGQAEEYNSALGDDLTNSVDERGPLSYDVRHAVKVSGRVLVPWYGGVRIGGLLQYRTGTPFSIVEQKTVEDYPTDLDENLSEALFVSGSSVDDFTFTSSTIRTFYPTGARNDQRNPPVWNLDLNVQKEFMIRDARATVQFDIFNVLNDDTIQTIQVFRERFFDDNREQVRDTPVAVRRQGRSFQLAFKLNF